MGPMIVVTLVHGTFATAAPWTKPDSALCRRLKNEFGDKILIEPFSWYPADNSIEARMAAAEKLSSHLARLQENNPEGRQYVIAHSHGGNVALDAVALYGRNLAGIACLATPFLHASVRDMRQLTLANLGWWFGSLFLLGGQVALLWYGLGRWLGLWVLVSWLLAAVAAGVTSGLYERLLHGIEIKDVANVVQSSVPTDWNLLIIRGAGDEAWLALGTSHLFSRYLSKIFNSMNESQLNVSWQSSKMLAWLNAGGWITESQAERFPRLRRATVPRIVWVGWIALFTALLGVAVSNGVPPAGIENLRLSPTFLALAEILFLYTLAAKTTCLDYLLGPIAFILLGTVSGLSAVSWGTVPTDKAFGGGAWRRLMVGLKIGLLVEVTAEPVPRGTWAVTQLGLDITGLQSGGLRHSIYEDPRVHDELAAWLVRTEGILLGRTWLAHVSEWPPSGA
jgi:hypothetical protein